MQAGALAMKWTGEVLESFGLSVPEYAALLLIRRFGGISQGVVGERLGLSKAAICGMAQSCERRRLISRSQDPWSPGRRALYLTDSGLQALAEATDRVAIVDARFRRRVDEASLLALAELPARTLTPVELALRAAGYCQ
jgi:DNA-binding MarR family transcriptional regulator